MALAQWLEHGPVEPKMSVRLRHVTPGTGILTGTLPYSSTPNHHITQANPTMTPAAITTAVFMLDPFGEGEGTSCRLRGPGDEPDLTEGDGGDDRSLGGREGYVCPS